MKKALLIAWILVLAVLVSGCGEPRVKVLTKTFKQGQINVKYPQLRGSKDKAAQKIINRTLYNMAWALSDKQDVGLRSDISVTYEAVFQVTFKKDNIISIKFMERQHFPWDKTPEKELKSITFDPVTGKVYRFKDLFTPGFDYETRINRLAKDIIETNQMQLLRPYKGMDRDQAFFLGKEGLVIYYQDNIYTTDVVGPLNIMIIYPKLYGMLREDMEF